RSRPPRFQDVEAAARFCTFRLTRIVAGRPARVARHTLCVSCESPWLLDPRSGEGEFSGNGSRTHRELATPSRVFGSDCPSTVATPQTDVQAMVNGFASVTPLNADLTTSGTSGASASSCPADPPSPSGRRRHPSRLAPVGMGDAPDAGHEQRLAIVDAPGS